MFVLQRKQAHSSPLVSICKLPHQPQLVVTNAADHTLRLWDLRTSSCAAIFTHQLLRGEPANVVASDCQLFTAVDNRVVGFSLKSSSKLICKEASQVAAGQDSINAVCICEGRRIATCDDSDWILFSGKKAYKHQPIPFTLGCNQQYLVSGGFDCKVKWYSLKEEALEGEIDLNELLKPEFSRAHAYSVSTAGGTTLVGTETGHLVSVENKPPFRVRYTVEAHLAKVIRAVRGSMGGKYFLSAVSNDSSLTLWKESQQKKSVKFVTRIDIGGQGAWVEMGDTWLAVAAGDNELKILRLKE